MSSLQHQAEAITRYLIDMESAQAVLINGEWGVGKSYFVREILTRSLENNGLNVVFYSLYGVDSLDSIREDIAYMLLQSRIGEFTIKGRKIPSFLVEKIPAIIKISARHLDVNDDISDINDSFESDLSKTVLVFDDLERASIDINVVLGFINSYLENTNAKIVIIANENEIGTSKLSTDLPQKYLVASNPHIQFEEEQTPKNKQQNNEKNVVFTHKQIIERTHALFSSDIQYATVKEKLIGLTVKINLRFEEVYDDLVNAYSSEISHEILTKMKPSVIEMFEMLGCHNLRTFIFAISIFDKLYSLLTGFDNDDDVYNRIVTDEINGILKYIIYCSIRYKGGFIDENREDTSKTICCIRFKAAPYTFIDHYIHTHQLQDDIREEVKKNIDEKYDDLKRKKEHDELSIFKVSDFEWLYKDDNEVEELINKMYDELEEGKYTERYYKDIISIFFQLDYNGFALSAGTHTIDDFIALMVTYISDNTVDSHFLDIMEAFGFDESDEKYSVYIQRLRDAFNKKEEIETASEYESVFSVEDWTEKFYDYCYENRDNFISKRSFLTDGLINILISKIDNASNRQIVKMCDAICIVYHFGNLNQFFKNDLEPLKRLVDYLKTIKQTKSDKQTRQIVLQSSISRLSIKYDTINR